MPSKLKPEGKHAVLAIDPGGTTGVFAGYVSLHTMLAETLQTLDRAKAVEVKGDWLQQSRDIANLIWRFVFTANVENAIPMPNIHVVLEDFVLRRRQSGGATGNLTSCWVAAGAVAAFVDMSSQVYPDSAELISWQQPSDAKRKTNDRLRSWGLYEHTIGSEHKRDAVRHFALKVDRILQQEG